MNATKKRLFFILIFLPWIAIAAIHKDRVAAVPYQVGIGPTVIIDAGHGGQDLGAKGRNPYCEEKRLALQTSRLVKKYLNQLGYHVVLTRQSDTFVPLPRRVEIANKASCDLFVSIHYNSSRTPSAQGVEVFFCDSSENVRRSTSSRKLASSILTRIIRRTQALSRGIKRGNLYVIRETEMPAVLVEGGFISNPQERSFLKDPLYIEKIARGIADGIDHYFKKK